MGLDEGPSVGTDDIPGLADGRANKLDKEYADDAGMDEGRTTGLGVPRDLRNRRDAGPGLMFCELSSSRALQAGNDAGRG